MLTFLVPILASVAGWLIRDRFADTLAPHEKDLVNTARQASVDAAKAAAVKAIAGSSEPSPKV